MPRLVLVVTLACLAGCAGPRRVKVHPVQGKLLVGGQPAADAKVAFHPIGQAGPLARLPVATTAADGSYRLMTYVSGDGAPAGEYAVTVVWPDSSQPHDECADGVAHDRLKGRYADPDRSPLRVTVVPDENEVPLRVAAAGSWSFPRMRDVEGK
jgi:hypothetical protein